MPSCVGPAQSPTSANCPLRGGGGSPNAAPFLSLEGERSGWATSGISQDQPRLCFWLGENFQDLPFGPGDFSDQRHFWASDGKGARSSWENA